MALPSGCIAGSQEVRIIILAGGRPVALVLLGDSWVPQNVVGGQPIHFGREEGVERTLLRVACQSETFLASPWQGDASIRFVGHIGCQRDFDELVSMACRPVDRGFCRMGETKEHPTPNKNTLPKQRHPTQTTTTLKQEHPTPNEDIPPKQGHPARTRTSSPNEDIPARTRTPARTKRFGKFLLNLPG